MMYLTLLEDAILRKFLEVQNISTSILTDMKTSSREFSDKGFVTELDFDVDGAILSSSTFRICAKVNEGTLDTSYTITVVGQKVCRLEGFTSGEDWPDLVVDFDVYASSIH